MNLYVIVRSFQGGDWGVYAPDADVTGEGYTYRTYDEAIDALPALGEGGPMTYQVAHLKIPA